MASPALALERATCWTLALHRDTPAREPHDVRCAVCSLRQHCFQLTARRRSVCAKLLARTPITRPLHSSAGGQHASLCMF